ncbi:MAG: alpha/beta fold hydrolase [Propioniciclava sp.]|uniref:alpha/beta fold hydrolase n=1 Tax=Propioniciclava sp. TaxID=2038686 RepID=UPI0039E4134E
MTAKNTSRPRRRWPAVLLALLVGLLGYGIGVAQPIVLRSPLVVGQDAVVDGVPAGSTRAFVAEAGGRVLVIEPTNRPVTTAFVLYPGGLVRPQAYEWLGHALAARGVRTLIPEFLADLAVTGADRAEAVAGTLAPGLPVVVGGHSLGGVMAARYAAAHPDAVEGLILMGAYSEDSTDLTAATFDALVLRGGDDAIAAADKVEAGVTRLPSATRVEVIDGAPHSFFGRYGPQSGDGIPQVSRAQAEAQIADAIGGFLAGVG